MTITYSATIRPNWPKGDSYESERFNSEDEARNYIESELNRLYPD